MSEYTVEVNYRSGLVSDTVEQQIADALGIERKDVEVVDVK